MVKLVNHGVVEIIGPIRQQLLSVIREQSQFERVREHLRKFPDLQITTDDYEESRVFLQSVSVERHSGILDRFLDMRGGNPKRPGHLYRRP
jgi:hypothetical protein